MKIIIFLLLGITLVQHSAIASVAKTEIGMFTGRVSKLNEPSSLIRVRIGFHNQKFLNKQNNVRLWAEDRPSFSCEAEIIGKTTDYLLLKVLKMPACLRSVPLRVGVFLRFYSDDLVDNIVLGKELMDILQKKKIVLKSKIENHKKEINNFEASLEALNKRYDVLREKLELERRKHLAKLRDNHIINRQNIGHLLVEMDELDFKIEQYKLRDSNLEYDRWALDSKLYIKK